MNLISTLHKLNKLNLSLAKASTIRHLFIKNIIIIKILILLEEDFMKKFFLLLLILSLLYITSNSWGNNIPRTYANAPIKSNAALTSEISEPRIILTFDDGSRSHYEIAFWELLERDLKGTFYVITNCLDPDTPCLYPTPMHSENAKEMYDAGMDIANHTMSHTLLSSPPEELSKIKAELSSFNLSMSEIENLLDRNLTLPEIENELLGAKTALDDLGMIRASAHVAYPFGEYDDTVLAAMANTGMLTGRTINYGIDTMVDIYSANKLYKLSIQSVEEQDDINRIEYWINEAIEGNATLIFMFHTIREDPLPDESADVSVLTDPYDISTAKFEKILELVVSSGIKSQTISEWYSDYMLEFFPKYYYFPVFISN